MKTCSTHLDSRSVKRSNLFRGLNFQWRQDAVDVELLDGVSSNRFDPSGLGGGTWLLCELEPGDMVKICWNM